MQYASGDTAAPLRSDLRGTLIRFLLLFNRFECRCGYVPGCVTSESLGEEA